MSVADLAPRVADLALRLHRRARRQDQVHGITGTRLSALERAASGPSLSLGALAAGEGVSPATMTRIVDGLEQGKLVVRRRSPKDSRVVEVIPTTLGRTLITSVNRRRLSWLEDLLAELGEDDRATIGRATEILAGALARHELSDPPR